MKAGFPYIYYFYCMDEKIQFLVIGKDPVVVQKLLRFINENPAWQGFGVIDEASAKTLFAESSYYAVILVDYYKESVVEELSNTFRSQKPETQVLQHFGDSVSLLQAELEDLLQRHPAAIAKED